MGASTSTTGSEPTFEARVEVKESEDSRDSEKFHVSNMGDSDKAMDIVAVLNMLRQEFVDNPDKTKQFVLINMAVYQGPFVTSHSLVDMANYFGTALVKAKWQNHKPVTVGLIRVNIYNTHDAETGVLIKDAIARLFSFHSIRFSRISAYSGKVDDILLATLLSEYDDSTMGMFVLQLVRWRASRTLPNALKRLKLLAVFASRDITHEEIESCRITKGFHHPEGEI
jgi:hypothetical protein